MGSPLGNTRQVWGTLQQDKPPDTTMQLVLEVVSKSTMLPPTCSDHQREVEEERKGKWTIMPHWSPVASR